MANKENPNNTKTTLSVDKKVKKELREWELHPAESDNDVLARVLKRYDQYNNKEALK